jgi:hypothetical protein
MHLITFDIPLKYFAPITLLGMFVHQIILDATGKHVGNHPAWLDGVAGGGLLSVLFLSLLTIAVYPGFWDVLGVDENQGAQVAYYAVRIHMWRSHRFAVIFEISVMFSFLQCFFYMSCLCVSGCPT